MFYELGIHKKNTVYCQLGNSPTGIKKKDYFHCPLLGCLTPQLQNDISSYHSLNVIV